MTAANPRSTADSKAALTLQAQELRHNLQTPISAVRVELERKISLRFPHLQGFLTEYSSNFSLTGMFVRSHEPRMPGTLLDFEFTLTDGLKLIRGTGEVVWARWKSAGPQRPAGMGIRFLRLDRESRRLIRWAVEKRIAGGAGLFDLEAQGAEVESGLPASPTGEPAAGSGIGELRSPDSTDVDRRRLHPYAGCAKVQAPRWRKRLATLASAVLTVILAAGAISISHPGTGSRPSADEPSTEAAAQGDPAEQPVSRPAETSEVIPWRDEASAGLIEATAGWARAWAEQRPGDYLAHYSRRFQPPRSMTRADWEALRTQRIRAPRFIEISIDGFETEILGPDRGRVSFDQVYRSDSYSDRTRKALEMILEEGSWKILDERADDRPADTGRADRSQLGSPPAGPPS